MTAGPRGFGKGKKGGIEMKMLVVDDEEIIVRGILAHLKKLTDLDITATGAYSGEEALLLLEQFRPDLLLTDIRMPDMDGLTLIETARKRALCDSFMILTAYEDFDYARRAIENQVLGYLIKPIEWDALDTQLRDFAQAEETQRRTEDCMKQYEPLFSHVAGTEALSPSLRKICRYVQKHYSDDLTLFRLAFKTGFAESHICALYKKELGITFLDYVNELRLRRAIFLLIDNPRLSIRSISSMVGYGSERQLYRLFKTAMNITPQQIRDAGE